MEDAENYDFYNYYSPSTEAELGGLIAFFLGISIFAGIIGLVSYIYNGITLQKIFKKAGQPRPWASWVPVYNSYVLLETGKQQGWWAFVFYGGMILNLIPFLGSLIFFAVTILFLIPTIFAYININKALFGKENAAGWTVLAVLLGPVWLGIAAWGRSTWDEWAADGPYFLRQTTQSTQPVYNTAPPPPRYDNYTSPTQNDSFSLKKEEDDPNRL